MCVYICKIVYCLVITSELHSFNFSVVQCSNLTDLMNATLFCLLGDDGVLSYEDTCNFTCNTGYELTGNSTRTCQSDGSWSGSDVVCRRGK